ncbi:MAG: hypothetical protein ABI688_08490 [Bacteroidota bacterium]
MDLNHIKLTASLVADLYTTSLIEDETTVLLKKLTADPATAETTTIIPWKSLGGNGKKILLIVNANDVVHVPDNELSFLTGILAACKLSLADVAIVNLHHYPGASYKELTSFFSSKIVLLFDTEPAAFGLPMNFPHYQIQPFAGNSFLYSPSLKELENDRVEKSKLWVSLKRLFNL